MSGLRSTLALCGILMVILNGCIADRRFSNCGQIESCFRYFEGPCTSDGKRQVCLALDLTSGACPAEGSTNVDGRIDAPAPVNGEVRLCRQNEFLQKANPNVNVVAAANLFAAGEFLCQNDDLVCGGEFYTFGIGSEFGVENTDSRQVTITNYGKKADCMGFTNACEASGNNDFTLRFHVSPCPNVTTTTAATTTTSKPCNCTAWVNFGSCSAPCGPGLQEQRRTCMGCNPPRVTSRFVPCNSSACTTTTSTTTVRTTTRPVDGMWGPWGPFGNCSVTCGGGIKTRTRTCNNPPPSNGGQPCVPPMQDQMICNPQTCDETRRQCRDRVKKTTCAGLRGRALKRCYKREC